MAEKSGSEKVGARLQPFERPEPSERVQAVARALCTVDGRDPDERTLRRASGAAGFHRFPGDLTQEGPQLWESYVGEAERFVAAMEAMQPFFERARKW